MSTSVLERITEFLNDGPFLSPSEPRRREIRDLQERLHTLEAEYTHTLRQMHLNHEEDRREILDRLRELQPSQPRFEYTFMPRAATPSTLASTNEIRDYSRGLTSLDVHLTPPVELTRDDLLTFEDFADRRLSRVSSPHFQYSSLLPFSSSGHGRVPAWYPSND